jgi:hypothetical protein
LSVSLLLELSGEHFKEFQMSDNRQFRVNLSTHDSDTLKKIAAKLGVNESEVIRKGLQLMSLYAKTYGQEENGKIVYQEGDKSQEILVL